MKKFLLSLLILNASAFSLYAQGMDKLRERITEANDKFVSAMIDGDFETMNSMYTENVLSLPSYQPMIRGLDAIKEMSELQKQSGWATKHFVLNTTDIIPAGIFAIEVGNFEIVMIMPEGPEEWVDNGKYITIWEMQNDGNLKIRIETWNTDINPWGGTENDYYEDEGSIE